MAMKHGLGRGLGALISDGTLSETPRKASAEIRMVPVRNIRRNPRQPRQVFDDEALAELTASIKRTGVLQPLMVRSVADGYELISGERRLRAATGAGLAEVPVMVKTVSDVESLEQALIENLLRKDLNIIEEGAGYQKLTDEFDLTQEQIAERVGKARATVANAMRVLVLPDEVKKAIVAGELSPGHAKLLAGLEIPEERVLLARRALQEGLSVRNLEKLIQKTRRTARKPRASKEDVPATHIAYLSDKLHKYFGTNIRISSCRTLANGKKMPGSIDIVYYSSDDLDRILDLLGLAEE